MGDMQLSLPTAGPHLSLALIADFTKSELQVQQGTHHSNFLIIMINH